jgi:hypothetical protein
VSSLSSGSSSSGSSSSTTSALQASFQTLVQDLGGKSNSASLSGFLQAFASQLQSGSSNLGNLVDSQA